MKVPWHRLSEDSLLDHFFWVVSCILTRCYIQHSELNNPAMIDLIKTANEALTKVWTTFIPHHQILMFKRENFFFLLCVCENGGLKSFFAKSFNNIILLHLSYIPKVTSSVIKQKKIFCFLVCYAIRLGNIFGIKIYMIFFFF